MTDRVAELGAIERVEMEVADATGVELAAQLGSNGGGDQLARGRQVVETLEHIVEPLRDRRAAGLGKAARGGDVGNRQDSRDDLRIDSRGCRLVAEAEEAIGGE